MSGTCTLTDRTRVEYITRPTRKAMTGEPVMSVVACVIIPGWREECGPR